MAAKVASRSGVFAAAAAVLAILLPSAGWAQIAALGDMPEPIVPMPILARFAVPAPIAPRIRNLGFAPLAVMPAGASPLRPRPAERQLPSPWMWDLASRG